MLTEFRLPDFELHARIRQFIDEGWLPVFLPDRISARYGSGSKCHACNQPVAPSQVKYDVEDPGNGIGRLSLHLGCYVLWQIECVKRMRKQHQCCSGGQLVPPYRSSKKAGVNGRLLS